MIQFEQPIRTDSSDFTVRNNIVYLNLYDKLKGTYELPRLNPYAPLWGATSQLTGKTKYWMASTGWNNKERYVSMNTVTVWDTVNVGGNKIKLGTIDFPLGFYDITIYQNTSNSNTDPAGLNVIYKGLMNLVALRQNISGTETPMTSVTYTEYTANDSETESIYITNATQ